MKHLNGELKELWGNISRLREISLLSLGLFFFLSSSQIAYAVSIKREFISDISWSLPLSTGDLFMDYPTPAAELVLIPVGWTGQGLASRCGVEGLVPLAECFCGFDPQLHRNQVQWCKSRIPGLGRRLRSRVILGYLVSKWAWDPRPCLLKIKCIYRKWKIDCLVEFEFQTKTF